MLRCRFWILAPFWAVGCLSGEKPGGATKLEEFVYGLLLLIPAPIGLILFRDFLVNLVAAVD